MSSIDKNDSNSEKSDFEFDNWFNQYSGSLPKKNLTEGQLNRIVQNAVRYNKELTVEKKHSFLKWLKQILFVKSKIEVTNPFWERFWGYSLRPVLALLLIIGFGYIFWQIIPTNQVETNFATNPVMPATSNSITEKVVSNNDIPKVPELPKNINNHHSSDKLIAVETLKTITPEQFQKKPGFGFAQNKNEEKPDSVIIQEKFDDFRRLLSEKQLKIGSSDKSRSESQWFTSNENHDTLCRLVLSKSTEGSLKFTYLKESTLPKKAEKYLFIPNDTLLKLMEEIKK